ncbi:MAG: SBBP repeat-containing protein, partial [Calditrichota bacterium]
MRIIIVLMLFTLNLVFAQSYQFDWTRQGGGAEDDELYGLTTTADGHYVVAGNFTGAFSLGDTVLNSAGEADVYVAKFTREAELVWAKRFGNELYDMALSVDTDKSGNIYAAGFVVSEDSKRNLDTDAWVVALAADGEELWTEHITSAQGDLIVDIAIGTDDILYLTGEYAGPGELGGYRLEEFGETDMFLAAYSLLNNRYEWVEAAGGSGFDSGLSVESTPDGELVWAGYFYEDTEVFGQQLIGEGFEDIFVIHLNDDASVNWMVTAGGEAEDVANSVAVDRSGNVLVTGSFEGFAQFDGVAV